MILEEARHCFQRANYGGKNSEDTTALVKGQTVCDGGVGFTPNGAALLRWRSGGAELSYMLDHGARTLPIETGGPLLWQPSSAADGEGVAVAVTGASTKAALHRTDSFIVINPSSPSMRTQLYRWNGFGFSATEDAAADKRYREHYAD